MAPTDKGPVADLRFKGTPGRALLLATLGFFGGFAGVSVFGPLVPVFQELLDLSPSAAGLLAAMPSLTGSMLLPLAVGSMGIVGASGWVGGLGALGGFVIPPVMGLVTGAVAGPEAYARGFLPFAAMVLLAIPVVLGLKRWSSAHGMRIGSGNPG